MNSVAKISYEKIYTDDIGKYIPDIIANDEITCISAKTMWSGAIDAFSKINSTSYFSCIYGDIRVVVVTEENNNNYKFSQYFLSAMDGKILQISPNTWYGVHNLREKTSIFLNGLESIDDDPKRMSAKIFNWRSKR